MTEKIYQVDMPDELMEGLTIHVNENEEVELMALENAMDLLELLRKRMVWVSQCKKNIFSPFLLDEMEKMRSDETVMELIFGALDLQKEMTAMAEEMIKKIEEYRKLVSELRDEKMERQKEEIRALELAFEMYLETREEDKRSMVIHEVVTHRRPRRRKRK